jgi:N-methylhydantoinase B
MRRNGVEKKRARDGEWTVFGPKPGLMTMTNRDMFAVSWQGGGGWGDPLDRDAAVVAADVRAGAVSPEAAREIYGVLLRDGALDAAASEEQRQRLRLARVGSFATDRTRFVEGEPFGAIGNGLFLARDRRGVHVVTRAGYILSTNDTRWRAGAIAVTRETPPPGHRIVLHKDLVVTTYYCPATGAQLAVDIHRRDEPPADDVVLDLAAAEAPVRAA